MWRDLVRDLAPSRRRARSRTADAGAELALGGTGGRSGRTARSWDTAGGGEGRRARGAGTPPTCTYLMIYRIAFAFLYFEEANVYMCQMDVFGCGPPRLLRLHRDTEGGRRGALRRVLTRRALGHWQIGMPCEDQSGARLQAAGCSLLGPGDNAVELPRPDQ